MVDPPTYDCFHHSDKHLGKDTANVQALGRGVWRQLQRVAWVLRQAAGPQDTRSSAAVKNSGRACMRP